MTSVRLACAAALLLSSGCKSAAGTLPGWDESTQEPTDEVAVNDPDIEETAPGSDPARPASPAPEITPPATDPPADTATGTPAAKSGPGPLPKPLHGKVKASCGANPGVGQRLKGFKLKTPDGKTISSASYRGRVLLVNFWGTWCKPCLKELPEFDQLYRRYRKHGLTLVAIATNEDGGPVKDFVDQRRLAAKVVIGGESYAGQYGSDKFPFSFVVDTKGVIKASYRGYKPECAGKLEADLRAQLEQRNQ